MGSFQNTMADLHEAERFTREAGRQLHDIMAEGFHALLEAIVSEAQSNLQNNMNINTGELLASIRILNEEGLKGEVGTDVEHAWYIEYGRGPVVPVHAKMLHWIDKDTGEDVFSMYAGPTEPMPFMEPAVIVHTEQFGDIAVHQLDRRLEDI